jgi:hypothetical protein
MQCSETLALLADREWGGGGECSALDASFIDDQSIEGVSELCIYSLYLSCYKGLEIVENSA